MDAWILSGLVFRRVIGDERNGPHLIGRIVFRSVPDEKILAERIEESFVAVGDERTVFIFQQVFEFLILIACFLRIGKGVFHRHEECVAVFAHLVDNVNPLSEALAKQGAVYGIKV